MRYGAVNKSIAFVTQRSTNIFFELQIEDLSVKESRCQDVRR